MGYFLLAGCKLNSEFALSAITGRSELSMVVDQRLS